MMTQTTHVNAADLRNAHRSKSDDTRESADRLARRMCRFVLMIVCGVSLPACEELNDQPAAREIGSPATSSRVAPESFCVVGYLPDYRVRSFDPRSLQFVTDLVYFSIEPTDDGQLDLKRAAPEVLARLREWKVEYGIRLWIAIGGWGRSERFAAVCLENERRSKFVDSLVRFCLEGDFDGIDLDWEFPDDAAQRRAYADLIVELGQRLDAHERLLSIAVASAQALPSRAWSAADRVNLMAYDGPSRHSTFEFAQQAVRRVVRRGAKPSQVALGIPFYGRGVENRTLTMTWSEISDQFHPPLQDDRIDDIYYNGPATVRRKVRFARGAGLAGVMIWELGQDAADATSLLRAVHGEVWLP